MRISKRIFRTNTFMVFCALVALFTVICTMMSFFGQQFLRDFELDAPADENIALIGQRIEQAAAQSLDAQSLDTLSDEFEEYGYTLLLAQGSRLVYPEQLRVPRRLVEGVQQLIPASGRAATLSLSGVNAALAPVANSDDQVLVAVKGMERFLQAHGHFTKVKIYVVITGAAAILTLLAISLLFTRRLVGRITTPLDALAAGAARIEDGDLSTPIVYSGDAEFEQVCETFNRMQEHLRRQQEQSALYERARTDMISGISHDLRTPLTAVKGYIKGVSDGVANTEQKRREYLEIAYRRAGDMDALLQRLFYFSRLETGNLPLFPVQTDLREFCQSFLRENELEIRQQGASIELAAPQGRYPVRIDTGEFKRVLDNLVENSLKYARSDDLRMKITLSKTARGIRLAFEDNGHGVPSEKLERLFEQFYRADEARSSEGSGLGLYIVKYIVQAHGGAVEARSSGGLRISILLPQAEEEREDA